jgi:hypothetical protein
MSVMDAASEWYASGTFWAGAGAVAGLVGALAGIWVTFAVGFPRRQLLYRIQAVAPLIAAHEGMRGNLGPRDHGRILAHPRAFTIELVSRGRKNISNDAYNNDQPLRFNVGSPIIDVLQVVSQPKMLPTPTVSFDGTFVNVGPSLIGRRHTITIAVLAEGQPTLTCESPLIDVQVRDRADVLGPVRRAALMLALLMAIMAGILTLSSNAWAFALLGGCLALELYVILTQPVG